VWVELASGRPVESLHPLTLDSGYSALAQPPAHPHQRCEIHASVRAWLEGWLPAWRLGAMLTVDYGDVFPELYHRRPHGTLRAYLLHQRLSGADIYQNVGRQDITADVNFTDYRNWAQQLGLQEIGFQTQADFLRPHALSQSGRFLNADGAGGAFKVVMHRR
jgi:SAM-dependent MidA family methyltransferase